MQKQPFHQRLRPVLLLTLSLLLTGISFHTADAGIKDIGPPAAYVAPPYVPPPPPVSRLHLVDNRDGTISDPDSGLMWAQKDSYAELGKCLNWFQSEHYVKELRTAGYKDWRMPTMSELAGIYDDTQENVLAWDGDPGNPLALDELFAEGAAYWYWSADFQDTDLTDCCALSFYFAKGMPQVRRFTLCTNGGVRAVRTEK